MQVFVDGLKVNIDYSDASCSTLRYDSSSGTVSCTNATATIVFKVRRCMVRSQPRHLTTVLSSLLVAGRRLEDRRTYACWL